jgi:ketosteroid isomerase-like protein
MRQLFGALGLLVAFSAGTAIAETADEKNVLEAHRAFEKAISALDVAVMEKVWINAPYVVVIHPSSSAPVIGWENVKKTYEEQVARNSELKVVLKDPKAHLLSPTTAYVTGIATVEAKRTNGDTATFTANTINVYEKRGDQWLLATHQATAIRRP